MLQNLKEEKEAEPSLEPKLKPQEFISYMNRSYTILKFFVNEIIDLLESKKLGYLSLALKTINNSYTMIYDSLLEYNVKISEALAVNKISRGVGLVDMKEFTRRLANHGSLISKTRTMKFEDRYRELAPRSQSTTNIKDKIAELEFIDNFKKFEFGDDSELVERRIKEDEEFESKVTKLLSMVSSRNANDIFMKETDPKVIVELCKRALRNMQSDSRKNINMLREKIISLEKYNGIEAEAPQEIEKIVEGLIMKVKFMKINSLKRVNMKTIRTDYSEAEKALLTAVDEKCHKIASGVANFIYDNRPEKQERGTMTKMDNNNINSMAIKKSNNGDKYANKVVRNRINNMEKNILKLEAELKKTSVENIQLKEDMVELTTLKNNQQHEINTMNAKIIKFDGKLKEYISENQKLIMDMQDLMEKIKGLNSEKEGVKIHFFEGFNKFKELISQIVGYVLNCESNKEAVNSINMMEYSEREVERLLYYFKLQSPKKFDIDSLMDFSLRDFDITKIKGVKSTVEKEDEKIASYRALRNNNSQNMGFAKSFSRQNSTLKNFKKATTQIMNTQKVISFMKQKSLSKNKIIKSFKKGSKPNSKNASSNNISSQRNLSKKSSMILNQIEENEDKKTEENSNNLNEIDVSIEEGKMKITKEEFGEEPSNKSVFLRIQEPGKKQGKRRGSRRKSSRRSFLNSNSKNSNKLKVSSRRVSNASKLSKSSKFEKKNNNIQVGEIGKFILEEVKKIDERNIEKSKAENVKKGLNYFMNQINKITLSNKANIKDNSVVFNFKKGGINYSKNITKQEPNSEIPQTVKENSISRREIQKKPAKMIIEEKSSMTSFSYFSPDKSSKPKKLRNKRVQTKGISLGSFSKEELKFLKNLKENGMIETLYEITNKGKDEKMVSKTALQKKIGSLNNKKRNSKSFNIKSKNTTNDNFRSSFYTNTTKNDLDFQVISKTKRNPINQLKGIDGKLESEMGTTNAFGEEKTKLSMNSSKGFKNRNRYRNMSGNLGTEKSKNYNDNIMSLKSANYEKCKNFFYKLDYPIKGDGLDHIEEIDTKTKFYKSDSNFRLVNNKALKSAHLGKRNQQQNNERNTFSPKKRI